MYLVEVMILIDFVVAEGVKGAEVDTIVEKGRSKATAAAKKNTYNMTVEENNNDDNKAGVTIYADSELTDLAGL